VAAAAGGADSRLWQVIDAKDAEIAVAGALPGEADARASQAEGCEPRSLS